LLDIVGDVIVLQGAYYLERGSVCIISILLFFRYYSCWCLF